MTSLLESIDSRTKLVGENRLELLLFRLVGKQIYAINVFKVREVVQLPPLTEVPNRHYAICGVAHIRGLSFSVVDLQAALGRSPLYNGEVKTNLIITEYNSSVQGFLVGPVDRIVNLTWDSILPPPPTTGNGHFLTAITNFDDQLIQIIDVEKVLADITPYSTDISEDVLNENLKEWALNNQLKVLIVDDSSTARQQLKITLNNLGIECIQAKNGAEGLRTLESLSEEGPITKTLLMMITDAEMPEMDGYRLTHEARSNPALEDLFIIMHTSLSGAFNEALVDKVGCNRFLSKFKPDEVANAVQERVQDYKNSLEAS